MTSYIEININSISDSDFQKMFDELCRCLGLPKNEFFARPLHFLFQHIATGKLAMTKQHLLPGDILSKKVDEISPDSAVYKTCTELAKKTGTSIEAFDGKSVLTLIKNCYKTCIPTPQRPRKPTQRAISRRMTTDIILRRRKNGDL